MPRARREVDPERAERERIRQRFKKRKKGLQKKARELCDMCGADITILLRSSTQKLYQFSSSTFFSFVEEFLREPEKVVDLTTGKLMTGQSLPEDFLEGELVAGGGHASSGGGGATPSRQYALRARRRRPATRMHLDQEEEEEDEDEEEEEDAGVQGDDDEEYVPAGVVRNAAVLHAMSHARPALTGVELSSATAAVLTRRRAAAALSSSPSSSSVKEEEVEQQEKQPQGEAVEEDFQSPSTWFNGPSMLETQQQQQQQQQKTRWGVAPLSMPSMVEGSGSSRPDAGAASLDPRTPQSAMSMHTALTVGTINTVTPFGSSAFPSAGRGAMLDQQQHQHQQQQQQQQHQQQLDFQTPTPFRDHQSPCGLFQDNSPRTAFSCSPMAR